ncbi:MAG: PleD family two-component system response regulator [Magnetococcales bacterium]|nr:PleD family two-component system response regulator [Magnetococcales bacterium]
MSEGMRILVVDDEKINRDLLNDLLRDQYKIMVAKDGLQAVKAATREQRRPDLILLDIMMPEMNGYEVCQKIKNEDVSKDIPIIFVTAKNDVDDEAKGFELGAVDYIAKPISPPIVRARVKTHLKLKRKTDLLEKMVSLDGLTEIPNRRALDEFLAKEWRRSQRLKSPLSVVMMDVDKFKPYNDNYGHGAGDDCLKKVARALMTSTKRPSDLVARYGGEEFCAVLPNTDLDGAISVAEAFRATISDLQIPHAFSGILPHVTISVGVAVMVPNEWSSSKTLQEAADGQLYEAKTSGRNQVRGKTLQDCGNESHT